jgi:DNA gyrase/topoisomerase IV subunit A
MISLEKIEEWIQEVEERPTSAANILRYVSRRLSDLSARNEELLAENIALRSGRKVEEYESRIANLEYQLELLKRQVAGEMITEAPAGDEAAAQALPSVLIYTGDGHVLRVEADPHRLEDPRPAAHLDEAVFGEQKPRLLAVPSQEELLFLFDSGRTETLPVQVVPLLREGGPAWKQALCREPRAGEELGALVPVARMALHDFVIQISRRGFVKKLREDFFETHLANHYIGAGVRLPSDKTCGLTLCGKDDLFVIVSREGVVFSMETARLPFTIEEAVRLGPTDQVLASFVIHPEDSLLLVTQTGKAVHRDAGWLEPAPAFKGRDQAVLSKARRESGLRLVGAAAVSGGNWAAALTIKGQVMLYPVEFIFNSGTLLGPGEEGEFLSFPVCK